MSEFGSLPEEIAAHGQSPMSILLDAVSHNEMDLRETAVTAEGVAELKKLHPNLKVIGFEQ